MNTSEGILKILLEPKLRYRGLWVSRVSLPAVLPFKRKTINDTTNYLKRKKYITVEGDYIKISENGRRYLKRRQARLRVFESPFSKKVPKNLLVIFDIPEARKSEREWFRRQLKIFGYEMIQKSVWAGPSPLPKQFTDYVKTIKLEKGIKTFKLASKK